MEKIKKVNGEIPKAQFSKKLQCKKYFKLELFTEDHEKVLEVEKLLEKLEIINSITQIVEFSKP